MADSRTPGSRAARRVPRGAVASPHYLSAATGLAVLADGGNAVDAAVAANLTLGVVAPYLCGYGGDLFAIVWDGAAHGYLGSGRSPAAATTQLVRDRAETGEMPLLGPHTVTVPGAVAGWFDLLERFGTRSFASLAADAITYARDGFPLTPIGSRSVVAHRPMYEGFDAWQAAYAPVGADVVLRQQPLSRLVERVAAGGPDAYYRGPVADAIALAVQERGGALDADDLAAHAGEWVEPLRARYRDVEVLELPPPTQGVTALEILRILDGLEMPSPGADRDHLVIEATKLALADRDAHISDPDAMSMPATALLDDAHIADRRRAIDPSRAGTPRAGALQRGGTAYLCAADAGGLLVSLIQSNFLGFGSGVHVTEWGINLHNRGSSFSLDEGSVNVLAPAKRAMHTLIPALAARDDEPWLVFGSMGADAQAQVHAQILVRVVDDGTDPQVAIDAPRWRVDPGTWALKIERRADPDVVADLAARGHSVTTVGAYDWGMGHAHAIEVLAQGYAVASDPRSEGAALGC